MADNTSTTCPKRLTRAGLFGIECRIHKVYGISPLAVKVWLAYARAVGCKAPLVEGMLEKAMAAGYRCPKCRRTYALVRPNPDPASPPRVKPPSKT